MKIQGIISAAVLIAGVALSAPTYACSASFDEGGSSSSGSALSTHSKLNTNLGCGEYEFANLHSKYGSSFNDYWKFTVAADSTASISVFDMEAGNVLPAIDVKEAEPGHGGATKIFDTKYLTFSLFDSADNLLGTAGENQTLSGLSLEAGEWYTIKVSGQVAGLFGSAYYGNLNTCVTAVPLGDSAPMLGSALALLALSYRKRLTRNA